MLAQFARLRVSEVPAAHHARNKKRPVERVIIFIKIYWLLNSPHIKCGEALQQTCESSVSLGVVYCPGCAAAAPVARATWERATLILWKHQPANHELAGLLIIYRELLVMAVPVTLHAGVFAPGLLGIPL